MMRVVGCGRRGRSGARGVVGMGGCVIGMRVVVVVGMVIKVVVVTGMGVVARGVVALVAAVV